MEYKPASIVKQLDPIECPHCNKKIYVGSVFMPQAINNIATEDDLVEAKDAILRGIEEIKFVKDEDKKALIEWVSKDKTLFDKTDIEPFLQQVGTQESMKASQMVPEDAPAESEKDLEELEDEEVEEE